MTKQIPAAADPERSDTVTELLGDNLGRLRAARPDFQAQLEARLVAGLPRASRPWWRRALSPTRSTTEGGLSRRWPLVGFATAAAVIVVLAGVTLLGGRPAEVSAAELLERAELSAANPFAAGLKSFHLKGKSGGRLPFDKLQGDGAVQADGVVEQWFSAPDRSRSETRSKSADGATTVSGMVTDGKTMTSYATSGHEGRTVSIMPMGIFVAADGPAPPPSEVGPSKGRRVRVEDGEVVEDQAICLRPERKGETTVAGRAAYLVEHEVCDGATAPPELRGRRSVLAIDKESYLPLKVEEYDASGKLEFRYEVTELEYDVKISDSIFSEIPPPGTVQTRQGPAPRLMLEGQEERP